MKLLILSIKLFIFGFFCDMCTSLCTKMTESKLLNNQPLNKKLLVFMSNLSNNSLIKWQGIEKRFIRCSLEKQFFSKQ